MQLPGTTTHENGTCLVSRPQLLYFQSNLRPFSYQRNFTESALRIRRLPAREDPAGAENWYWLGRHRLRAFCGWYVVA
jgi:hypothetical protein